MRSFTSVVKRAVPFSVAFIAGIVGSSFVASPDLQEKKIQVRKTPVTESNLICSNALGAVGQLNRNELNEEIELLNEEMRRLYERQIEISAATNVESKRYEMESIGRKIKAAERNLVMYKLRNWVLESEASRNERDPIKLFLEHKCVEF
jgi:hypothetical protein